MDKRLIIAARTLTLIFNPLYLPLLGMALLFSMSYLSMYPSRYKWSVAGLVYLFTVLMPTLLIRAYRNYHGWHLFQLGQRERRMVPYIASIVSYFTCYFLMVWLHIPHFISIIVVIALDLQITCAIINVWWKISTHSAAAGAVTSTLVVFSLLFNFYLLWWLSLSLIVAGMVMTARMILRQHTLQEVVGGFAVGMAVPPLVILYF